MSGRWEFLEGVRPVTAAEAIVAEMAKIIAEEISGWPPHVEWTDAAQATKFAPLYVAGAAAPDVAAVRAGFQLARWELVHEQDAIDYYFRNAHTGAATDRLAIELLWKFLPELLYELAERTENRLKRFHLLACLDQAERRLLPPAARG